MGGNYNDGIGGLVGFILLGDCCVSLRGNHYNGVTLYDLWQLLFSWQTGTQYQNLLGHRRSEVNVISR